MPFVMGIPQSMPNTFSSQALAIRVLRDEFPQIVDATEPGAIRTTSRAPKVHPAYRRA